MVISNKNLCHFGYLEINSLYVHFSPVKKEVYVVLNIILRLPWEQYALHDQLLHLRNVPMTLRRNNSLRPRWYYWYLKYSPGNCKVITKTWGREGMTCTFCLQMMKNFQFTNYLFPNFMEKLCWVEFKMLHFNWLEICRWT